MSEQCPEDMQPELKDRDLDVEVSLGLGSLRFHAWGTARYLREGWQQSTSARNDDFLAEKASFWHTICLAEDCRYVLALDSEQPFSVFPLPMQAAPEVRYECEAAIRTVSHLLPFDEETRELFRGTDLYALHPADVATRNPEVFKEWHQWLGGEAIRPLYGRPAELLIAADRLSKNLSLVLDSEES
jgi:hypothetical protein